MSAIPEALAIAFQHHQAGQLESAEQIYQQILQVEPNHADAIHLLGVIAHQVGKHETAIEYIERAITLKATDAAFHNNLGEAYRAIQRVSEAISCYRRALELNANYLEAHNNLGNAMRGQGELDEAIACYRRSLELRPGWAEALFNVGNALKDKGNLDEAVSFYGQAVELKPDFAGAYNNLGNALKELGKLNEAVACYRRARELQPDLADAHYNLGNVLKEQEKPHEAVACYQRALDLNPNYAEAYNNLGVVLFDQGKLEEAVACYRRATELKSHYAEALNNLGNALNNQGKRDEAVACYRQALELNYAGACINLGVALMDQGKLDEAVACYRRGLEIKSDFAEAYNNLGYALLDEGKLDEAVACVEQALGLKPNYAEAHNNLGNVFKQQGKLNDAIACYRRALDLEPDFTMAHSNLLFTLQYRTGITLAELAQAHTKYDDQHATCLRRTVAQHKVIHRGHDQLMLGFVSPDLWRHPVGRYLVRVLENLRHNQCATVCYSDRRIKDDTTYRLQGAATQWRDVVGMSDERLAEQIRDDRIDVLFDLSGHSAGNRLLVFARKPAPIQITWIGYEGTTGLATMDYLLADRHMVPEESRQFYREQVLQMPDGYLCYDPPVLAPPVGRLPALDNGYVTFGSFNNPAKITSEVVTVWAEILRRIPTSRLIIKYLGMGEQSVQRRYLDLFATHDVAPERLEFLPFGSYAEYLATYDQVDIGLDPFPFSGSATTCDALWMGVPVITCPGETFASRHGLSHLSNIGLTECVARDLDHYVELAMELATDLSRLAQMRAQLREQMAASPLCDGPRFARNLEALLQQVWEQRVHSSK